MILMKGLVKFFDRLEDVIRGNLSHYPILYGIFGGVAIVLFWRGVWEIADTLEQSGGILGEIFSAPTSTILSTVMLLISGLFVSFFIGDRIILSGLKHEKKVAEKTEVEVRQEETVLIKLAGSVDGLEKEIAELKKEITRRSS